MRSCFVGKAQIPKWWSLLGRHTHPQIIPCWAPPQGRASAPDNFLPRCGIFCSWGAIRAAQGPGLGACLPTFARGAHHVHQQQHFRERAAALCWLCCCCCCDAQSSTLLLCWRGAQLALTRPAADLNLRMNHLASS